MCGAANYPDPYDNSVGEKTHNTTSERQLHTDRSHHSPSLAQTLYARGAKGQNKNSRWTAESLWSRGSGQLHPLTSVAGRMAPDTSRTSSRRDTPCRFVWKHSVSSTTRTAIDSNQDRIITPHRSYPSSPFKGWSQRQPSSAYIYLTWHFHPHNLTNSLAMPSASASSLLSALVQFSAKRSQNFWDFTEFTCLEKHRQYSSRSIFLK